MARTAERDERRRDEGRLVDRRLVAFGEPPGEPAGGDAGVAARILHRDQGSQLQSLDERDPTELTQRVLGDEQVAALDSSLEGRPRMALLGRTCLSGAGRPSDPSGDRR